MDADLRSARQPVSQFETDLRAGVESEEVRRKIAKVSLSERSREPVRDAERQLVHRHPQRRRQRREIEIRLERIDAASGSEIGLLPAGQAVALAMVARSGGVPTQGSSTHAMARSIDRKHVIVPHLGRKADAANSRRKSSKNHHLARRCLPAS